MKTRKQIRRQSNKIRLSHVVRDYNKLYDDGIITHVEMSKILGKNITTFLRWRKLQAIPSSKMIDKLELLIEEIKG